MKKEWKKWRKKVLRMVWSFSTAFVMVLPYEWAMRQQEPIIICILKLLCSFLIMNILCSRLENTPLILKKVEKYKKQKQERQEKKKERKLQQKMQKQILQEEKKQKEILENAEIEKAECIYERLVNALEEQNLGEKESKMLGQLLEEIHLLLEILKEDNTHYEKAGYMLRICLPELENITNIYLDMLSITSVREEDTEKYCSFLRQFEKYLECIKEQIYSVNRTNLELSTSVIETIMQSRMKNNEEEETL